MKKSAAKKPAKKFAKMRIAADEKIAAALAAIKKRPTRRLKRDMPKWTPPKRKKSQRDTTALSSPLGLAEWIEANIVLPNTVAEPGPMRLWPWQYGLPRLSSIRISSV